ncbi:hypothetical protein DWV00_08195 [Trinickia dinghuensis]|uniref:Serine/threonine protein kinase n=1 Tax=Trinickia dinghuensis TaxID=2291023 RepID=A0A3D8K3C7_9BURK|nr:hypothetical protein DWV00_08195 [Trinickia dinghuensis]
MLNFFSVLLCVFAIFGAPNAHAQAQSTLQINGVTYTLCASEYQACSFKGAGYVVFGTTYAPLKYSLNGPFTNGVTCSNGIVAPTDPAYGYPKSCWYATTLSAPSTSSVGCSTPTITTGGTPNGLITADTPSADGTRMFAQGSTFQLAFTTNAPSSDTVTWSVQDYMGNIRGSGSFPVASGTQTNTLSCTASAGGYFAVTATLTNAGGTLPEAGTRPTGIATFGILPNVSSVLPAPTFAHTDQHRFGMQGFNGNNAMLADLGVTQTIDNRQLSFMEPNGPNSWTPSLSDLGYQYTNGKTMRLIRLDGIPAWASPTGAYEDDTYAPTANYMSYYQGYMARVGADTAAIRQAYFPNQQSNYYQVTWEPQWADSAANYVAMYKAVYTGLHSTDPNAIVMGSTSPHPSLASNYGNTLSFLQTYAPLGIGNYIDGVSTHGYYGGYNNPGHPPEQFDTDPNPANVATALDQQMRALRAEMQQVKPNMRLWNTEVGISYDAGSAYGPNCPSANQLYAQAAVAVRTHLTILGEGAQVTYFFYGSDYPSEVGFGTFFDIVDPQGSYGATTLSPKPEAVAFAALTRIVDGTQTLGYLNNLPSMVHGYAFQQLGGGKVITTLWTHNNTAWPTSGGGYSSTYSTTYALTVDNPGTNGTVTVFDLMGNPTAVPYINGVVTLTLTESPIYVVSSNANVIASNVTVPVGYTGQ